ncbi:hypothetical protein KPL78_29920, partial [Roseomonas sp. HJA6]|nr:hypothetical protein [Neoroseomonas alba]
AIHQHEENRLMQRVTRATAAATLPVPPASPGTPGYFARPNTVAGVQATVPGYEWYNGVQEAICQAFQDSGIAPDAVDHTQLRKHIRRLAGGNVRVVTGNTTLTPDDAGLVLVNAGGPTTITLPSAAAANGRPLLFTFVRIDALAALVLVARAGSDTVEGGNNVPLPTVGRMAIVGDGSATWRVSGETAWGRSIGNNGYIRLPGGLIQQWGNATLPASGTNASSVSVTLPMAFPTAIVSAVVSARGTARPGGWLPATGVLAASTTSITITGDVLADAGGQEFSQTCPVWWQALGY